MAPQFIALDGIDGVGKSTQVELLSNALVEMGKEVVRVRDPGGTPVGDALRALLLDSDLTMHRRTEAMLFLSSRCELVETVIRPALDAGKIVLTDRFLLSTVVYQSLDNEGNQIVDPQEIWSLGELSIGGLRPDATVLLDLPATISMTRFDNADRMESRGEVYLESVRQSFLAQVGRSSDTTGVIDASQSVSQVHEQIMDLIQG